MTSAAIGKKTDRGHNMCTRSGMAFFPLGAKEEEILVEDIAHGLSMQCRYNGHTVKFYSVAQHCWLASQYAPAGLEFEALMHDAAEAYIGDIISPLKVALPDYARIEKELDATIRRRFGLPVKHSPEIKEIDTRLAITERRDLLPECPDVDWGRVPDPYPEVIIPWGWESAKERFLARFYALTNGGKI